MGIEELKMLTPEAMAKIQKERILSDADLVNNGAEVDAEARIYPTNEQIENVKKEMEDELYENSKEQLEALEAANDFQISGENKSELIRQLKQIAGQSIRSLEQRMRPGHDSEGGFLGANENLLDVLADDNDFVLSQRLTHQDLAEPLQFVKNITQKEFADTHTFQYKDCDYQVDLVNSKGPQFSPFEDGTNTSTDAIIKNLSNGEEISLSLLVPDMVERYGFYEGKGSPYRVEPSQIIKVFPDLALKDFYRLIAEGKSKS